MKEKPTDLFTDVVSCNADQVQDGVHIPRVVHRILLRQDGYFQNLQRTATISAPNYLAEPKVGRAPAVVEWTLFMEIFNQQKSAILATVHSQAATNRCPDLCQQQNSMQLVLDQPRCTEPISTDKSLTLI